MYLLTTWRFMTLRPKRFAAHYARNSDSLVTPWPYLLVSGALGACFAAVYIQQSATRAKAWDWALLGSLFVSAIVVNLFVVASGAVAAWLLSVPVSISGLMTAFAYSSAWVPIYLPINAAAINSIEKDDPHPIFALAAMAIVQAVYLVYLVLSLGRFNYMEGKPLLSFFIITATLSVAVGVGAGAFIVHFDEAASEITWNVDPPSTHTLQVSNYTNDATCKTCWSNAVSAKPGDVISFDIFYCHGGNATAEDTRARLVMPEDVLRSGVIGAEVWSKNSTGRASGFVTVKIDSNAPVSLAFVGGERYLGAESQPARFDVTDRAQITDSSGIGLGNIGSGWDHQGDLVLRFAVVETTSAPRLQNPSGVAAQPDCRGGSPAISITWDGAPLADSYVISRNGVRLATAPKTSFVDQSVQVGTVYTYAVTACRGSECVGGTSEVVTAAALSCAK